MKKLSLFLFALVLSARLFCQDSFLEISEAVDTVYLTPQTSEVHLVWPVVNVSDTTYSISCRLEMIQSLAGSFHQFCWDTLYCSAFVNETTDMDGVLTMEPGDTGEFSAKYRPNNMAGLSIVKYCWYDEFNGQSKYCRTIVFCSTEECSQISIGTSELSAMPTTLSLFPNPAKDEIKLDLSNMTKGNIKLNVLDPNLNTIYSSSYRNFEGVISIPCMDWSSGVYFIFIEDNRGNLKMSRVTVIH